LRSIDLQSEKAKSFVEQKVVFERVFRSTDGEIILGVLSDQCISEMGVYEPDSHKVMFNEGKRNIFLTILKLASISVEDFLKKLVKIKVEEEI
jgi:hypothetical protein